MRIRNLTRTGTQDWGFSIGRAPSNGVVVRTVSPLGIAGLAGIHVNDFIISVNGTVCSQTPFEAVETILSSVVHVRLEFRRPVSGTPGAISTATPRSSVPSTAEVIELDSDDDDDDEADSEESDMLGRHYNYNDDSEEDDSDDEEDSVDRHRLALQRAAAMQRAASMQRAAMARQQSAVSAPPRAPVPYNPGEVIDLMSDDDEPPRPAAPIRVAPPPALQRSQTVQRPVVAAPVAAPMPSLAARSITAPALPAQQRLVPQVAPAVARASTTAAPAAPAATSSTASNPGTANKRALDTSADTPATGFKRRKVSMGGVEIKLEFEPKKFGEADIGDEVIEVHGEDEGSNGLQASASKASMTSMDEVVVAAAESTTTAMATDDDDFEGDFQIVGNTMQVASDMPHQRYSCTMYPFRMAPTSKSYPYHVLIESAMQLAERRKINILHCPKCYCYVCDSIVSDCGEWNDHCHATHKEPKWKIEKDARNSKILSLMTPQNRSAFFARYKAALVGTRSAAAKGSSFWDSDDEDGSEYGYSAGSNSSSASGSYPPFLDPSDLSNTTNLVNLICAKLVKCKKDRSTGVSLKPSSSADSLTSAKSSTATSNKEVFLEASELLLRCIVSPKHSTEGAHIIAKALVIWLMHPLCTTEVRGIIRAELINATNRSMAYAGSTLVSLRDLVSLDEASLNRLKNPPPSGAPNPMPPLLMQLSEQVLSTLITELLNVGHFDTIRQLVAHKPNLVPTLLMFHLKTGTMASCKEATALTHQYTNSKPFSTLKASLQEVEPEKLFKFLGTVIANNIKSSGPRNASNVQEGTLALPDGVADTLFNILLAKIYDAISTIHVPVIVSSVDTYMAKSLAADAVYRIEDTLSWIEAESAAKQFFSPLVVYLLIKYANWRVRCLPMPANCGFGVISALIVTPAAFCNLKLPAYVVLANSFCKHFAAPPPLVDAGGVQANVLMACTVALRAARVVKNAGMLAELDPAIRDVWMSLPEVRKAKPGEVCNAQTNQRSPTCGDMFCYRNECLELKFCPVVSSSGVRSIHPSNAAPSSSQQGSALLPLGTRRAAIYCDVHYTYDTFLMSLITPKNAFETKTALACLGHLTGDPEIVSFALCLEDTLLIGREDSSVQAYITFLMTNRELLLIIWKGLLIYMYRYMHALYNMDTTSMTGVLSHLARVLKPWLGSIDPMNVKQFSTSPLCRGYSQSQLIDLMALDVNLRMCYSFAKLLAKIQVNGGALSVADLRSFKSAIVVHESANTQQALASRLCQMYLLEYPVVSVRAIWHSFWRRYLLSFVSKRAISTYATEAVSLETQSVNLLLEDWKQVHDMVAKVATKPQVVSTFITALTHLQRSDLESMNYGGVSGAGELKKALEKLLTTPETSLALISEKCVEQPDSALASLVQQLNPTVLQAGALQFQAYFAYALQKRVDASVTSIAMTPEDRTLLTTAHQTVIRIYESCVSLIASPSRNPQISYSQVVKGCAYLRRYDLVATCVAAGMVAIVGAAAQASNNPTTNKVLNLNAQCKLVFDVLILAHSSQDFEELLRVMDSFIAQAYTEGTTFSLMAPVIRKFCPSAALKITRTTAAATAQTVESARVKLFKFYHSLDTASFDEYWQVAEKTEEQKTHLLIWLNSLRGTSRFNTSLYMTVVCEVLGVAGFVESLKSAEVANAALDKLQIIKTLVKLIAEHPAMVPAIATALVCTVLRLSNLTDDIRTLLESVATETILPLTAAPHNAEYVQSRVLLLFLTNPATYSDHLSAIYIQRSTADREGMCKFLMNRNKPGLLIKLLLRASDYQQLFKIIVDTYYTSAATLQQVPSIPLVASAIEEIRTSLGLLNLYDAAAPTASNASLNAFQKELFRDDSFVVNLAKFLLLLVEQHIDDKVVAYPEPLGSAIQMLVEHVKQLAHGDVVIASYLRLHMKFTAPHVVSFITDCTNCNYLTMPYTPTIAAKSRPCTFCVDVITAIVRAPKFYTVVFNHITTIYAVLSNPNTQQVMTGNGLSTTLISNLITSPCKYRCDIKTKTGTSSKGLLWIPKVDSSNTPAHCIAELSRLLISFGTHLSEILEELILLRLWSGEVVHNPAQPLAAVGSNQLLLKDWVNSNPEGMLKLAETMKPANSYGYLLDLISLYTNFNHATFAANLHQALSRPYAHLYRKIVVNLTAYWVTRGIDMKVILKVLCHEFHHPNNVFGTFFTEAEANLIIDYMESSGDAQARVRTALICRENSLPLPINSLLKYPRLLNCINKDFAAEGAYDSFGSLYHASNYMVLWQALAKTAQSQIAFDQSTACFRAIIDELKSRTVAARYRTQFEGLLNHFKVLFDSYPDKMVDLKTLKQNARTSLKTKGALVKCLAVLG